VLALSPKSLKKVNPNQLKVSISEGFLSCSEEESE